VQRQSPRILRPFATKQYRILVVALAFSLFGGGVWLVALVWQVIELGGGPGQLAIVSTANAVGLVATVLLGGVAADRVPQKRILLTVEVVKTVAISAVATLALLGNVELWHLAIAAFVLGVADGFYYPAYSAMLPSILPEGDLLAANGFEGVLRPAALQAAGPAVASAAIAVYSPALALSIVALAQLVDVVALAALKPTPVRRETVESSHPIRAVLSDLAGGFRYMVKTPWLLATLLFACILTLLIMGPIEVLIPFAIRDNVGGGAGDYALALAAFGVGGALGSILVASRPLPRRYLTIMNVLWGAGTLPLAVIGITSSLWVIVVALFVTGFSFSAATVIWGTLLQRRVPPELLGRVSSLDFFVSLALMPVSMAIAGSIGEIIGLPLTFIIAGGVPVILAVIAIVAARLPKDEIEHPLDTPVTAR
jgi:MFS family permease